MRTLWNRCATARVRGMLLLACVASLSMASASATDKFGADYWGFYKPSRPIVQVVGAKDSSNLSAVAGGATLLRDEDRWEASFNTTQLEPYHVYTIWWLIHTRPEKCASNPCTGADLFNPATGTSAFWGGGFITGADGSANVSFVLNSGQLPEGYQVLNFGTGVPAGFPRGYGLRTQVKIVIRSSGTVDANNVGAQLAEHLACGDCTDRQVAIFEAVKRPRR